MPRADLLALSDEDLASLSNRGTVKSARKELEEGRYTGEVIETDCALHVRWSDGIECHLEARAVLRQGRCSCQAITTCKHLVRMVLAYQKQQAAAQPEQAPGVAGPWDPGTLTDEELAKHYRPAVWARIQESFATGVLAELLRSARPMARFHLPACTVRFLVPGDPRYTRCDCSEPAPCQHVPLAVWAFRLLAADQTAGIVATGAKAPPIAGNLLEAIDKTCLDLVEHGVSGAPSGFCDRLARLEERCRQADLVWPAEVLSELVQQQHRYLEHDARFAPERVADLLGELLIRLDASRSDTGALPQPLIRGTRSDRPVELGTSRYIGLGCAAWPARHSVELAVYLQDADSGSVVALTREFTDHTDPDRLQRPFADLARGNAVKGGTYAALGAGQLLLRGGKRTTSFHLQPGRAAASVQPQSFAWEELQPPALIGEFAELEARLNSLPPSVLRSRRVTEDFHVCTVVGAEQVRFDDPTQTIEAVLVDARGHRALLSHPYTTRGQAGAETLLARLLQIPSALRFVSGTVRRTAAGLVIHPVALVWQEANGRSILQPWIEKTAEQESIPTPPHEVSTVDPLADYLQRVHAALGDLLVLGLQRADAHSARTWRELQKQGEALGLGRLSGRLAGLAEMLEQKQHTLQWEWTRAGQRLLTLLALVRLLHDLPG